MRFVGFKVLYEERACDDDRDHGECGNIEHAMPASCGNERSAYNWGECRTEGDHAAPDRHERP